jgi:hypothetical protein
MEQHRGVRNPKGLPPFTVAHILAWADAHHERTGRWPTVRSGPIEGSSGETWRAVEHALQEGFRGLPGGTTLARLLEKHRGVRNKGALPCLTIEQILIWADAHYARTGRWPDSMSGPIAEAPDETWCNVNYAFHSGARGLPAGLSLNAVLAEHRGVPRKTRLGHLTVPRILRWAHAYRNKTGKWPTAASGPLHGTLGPNWRALDLALRRGYNGLPGGWSLYRLLAEHACADRAK